MASAAEKADVYIESNPVMVFSKSYCPHCGRTKDLLKKKQAQFGFRYKVLELDELGDEGAAMQDALAERQNRVRTVPMIYIMQDYKGGDDDIQNMGLELDQKLQLAAEAEPPAVKEPNSPMSELA